MNKKLEDIFDRFLDGNMSDKEVEYLEYMKHHSPEEYQEFIDLVAFEEKVNHQLKEERSGDLLADLVIKELTGESPNEEIAENVIKKLRKTPTKTIRRIPTQRKRIRKPNKKSSLTPWLVAALITLSFGLGMILFQNKKTSTGSQYIASLSSGELSGLLSGSGLSDGKTYKASKKSVVKMKDGTVLTLQKDAEIKFDLNGARTIYLQEGRMHAKVAKQLNGTLNFQSPLANAEILGTEFDFVHEEEQSSLNLHEGKVKFSSLKTGESKIMTAGDEYIVIQTGEMTAPYSNSIRLFTLVDTRKGKDLKIIQNDITLKLSEMPKTFSVKAYLQKPQALRFKVNGYSSKIEQNPPYFVVGNEVEPFSIHPWRIGSGNYKVEVEFLKAGKTQFTETLNIKVVP